MKQIDYAGYISISHKSINLPYGLSLFKSGRLYSHEGKRISEKRSFLFLDLLNIQIVKIKDKTILKYISSKPHSFNNMIIVFYNIQSMRWEISKNSIPWHILTSFNFLSDERKQIYTLYLQSRKNRKEVIFTHISCDGYLDSFLLYCDFAKGSFAIHPPGFYRLSLHLPFPYSIKRRIIGTDAWNECLLEQKLQVSQNEEFLISNQNIERFGGYITITKAN